MKDDWKSKAIGRKYKVSYLGRMIWKDLRWSFDHLKMLTSLYIISRYGCFSSFASQWRKHGFKILTRLIWMKNSFHSPLSSDMSDFYDWFLPFRVFLLTLLMSREPLCQVAVVPGDPPMPLLTLSWASSAAGFVNHPSGPCWPNWHGLLGPFGSLASICCRN